MAMAIFGRTLHHEGKISPAWRGGCTPVPFHSLQARTKLWCTLFLLYPCMYCMRVRLLDKSRLLSLYIGNFMS
jgi:hypothetical protein